MKIVVKIGLAFLIVAIAINVIAAFVFYPVAQESLRTAICAHLATTIESRKQHIITYLSMLKLGVEQLSKSVVLEDFLKVNRTGIGREQAFETAMRRLKRTKEANPFIYEFMLIDASGKVVASSRPESIGRDMSADALFLGGQKSPYIKDVYISEALNKPLLGVSAPMLDSQTNVLIGVITARVDLAELYQIVTERIGLGNSGEIYLVNKYGFMVTPSRFLGNTFLKQEIDVPAFRSPTHPCPKEGQALVYLDYRGVTVLGIHEYIPQMQWMLYAEVDTKEAFAPLAKMREHFMVALLLAALAALLLGRAIAELIVRPIQRLHKGVEIVGTGNLDYKTGINTKDEIGQLSRAFDQMSERLKSTTTSVQKLNLEIAERKKAQETSRDSEENFRHLFESSRDAIMTLDRKGFTDCNNKTLELFKIEKKKDFIAKHPFELSPPVQPDGSDSLAASNKHIEQAFKSGSDFFEWLHKKADGTVFPAEVLLSRFQHGGKEYLQATVRDITLRRQEENQIARSLEEWSRTFNSISDLIFILDQDFNIVKVNDACCKMLKLKPEQIIGRKCFQIMHNLDHPWPSCPHARVIKEQIAVSEEVNDPHIGVPLLVSVSPIFDASGKYSGSVHIARDITERKKAEKALIETAEMKTNFTSTVSHELRTPLAAIKEGINIVLDGCAGQVTKDQVEFLNIAKRNVDRLGRMINDVLDFQRLQAGNLVFNMQVNNINEIVKEVKETMNPVAIQKKLELLLELGDKLPDLPCDRDRIVQVLTNLVNNAIKFTEKGLITISTAGDGDFIKVSIKDTGIGIKEVEIPVLFEQFKQLDTGMGRKTGGMGMGLTICRGIIERHRGKISVESKINEGSTFSFTLPLL